MKAPRYKWQPTTAEIARRVGIGENEVIRFDRNTSPYPTEWARELAAAESGTLNEYPDATYAPLREAAAALTGLEPNQIVPGAGVDELILLCGRAFLGTGKRALQIAPTYQLYGIATIQVEADLNVVDAAPPCFAFPVDAAVAAARDVDLVWLCVPNNPTGTSAKRDDVDEVIAASDGLVVIDAAYAEFSDLDWSDAVRRHRNVIVLRTLSKAFGLAGARVGFAMAHPSLIDALDGVRPPGSIPTLSVALGVAALEAPGRAERNVARLVGFRDDLEAKLSTLGWDVVQSDTNFVLAHVGPGAEDISAALMDRGLVVRTFTNEPLATYIRVTVRRPEEHDRLVAEIRRITL